MANPYGAALDNFLRSDDFKAGVISSTKAGWGGGHYSVELFDDGTYRTLWSNQIGNLYRSPGAILALPAFDAENVQEIEGWTEEEVFDQAFLLEQDDMEKSLRDALDNREEAV